HVNQGEIWSDPETGQQMEVCPWLRKVPKQNKYTCDIYYDRPDDCKYYPSTVDEMVRDECEMLEEKDRANPKQARRALDQLMQDSRTPFE
ncbi:MAG: YkgJ family cysteine cluster protein, partial [Gammaproteobacteria bacterium]|nr:YkgJ family cysteine cluster protein [Gammaproteobacteria bacterium]